MWCLKTHDITEDITSNENAKCLCIYMLPNQKKCFGKLSEVKLEGDDTISRVHAVVSVESTGELGTPYKCVISDESKYGTFVIRDKEKKRLPARDKFVLKAGDIVHFGLKETTFIVSYHSFVIARSSLNEEDAKKLKDIADYLGGRLSENWDNSCTHLTVSTNILLTTKLACALASAKPIITLPYWEAVTTAVKESKELPDIESFLPKVTEEWLVNSKLLPDEKRKTLFKHLSFVHFCIKQYFTYASLITAAGGKSCVYPTKRPLTPRDLIAKNAIVIQESSNDSSELSQIVAADYPIIYRKLQSVKRRMVSDFEIPLAILHCSTEMYCNPKFDFATFLKLKNKTCCPSDVTLIEDTQNINNIDKRQIKRKIIPETFDSQDNENIPKKYRSNQSEQRNVTSTSKSNIATTNKQNNREIKRTIIPETCDSQKNENILKKVHFSDENEQRNISDTSKDNIAVETQNNGNILKNIYFSNKNEQKHISGNSQTNIVTNICSKKINKQIQIIPESHYSSDKCEDNIFSGKSNNKQIIPETCTYDEQDIVNNFITEREQQNVELQEKKVFKENNSLSDQQKDMLGKNKLEFQQRENILMTEESNSFLIKNQQEKNVLQRNEFEFQQYENIFMTEENDSTIEKSNLNRKENPIIKSNLNNNNNKKSGSTGWENSKNSGRPQILSAEAINNSDIYIDQRKISKELVRKDCSRVEEWQNSSKERKLNSVCNSEKNRENKKAEENKIQENNKRKEKPRKMGANWYERYVNQKFTDEILRTDIPNGKRFTKVPVMIPEKILKAQDFTL